MATPRWCSRSPATGAEWGSPSGLLGHGGEERLLVAREAPLEDAEDVVVVEVRLRLGRALAVELLLQADHRVGDLRAQPGLALGLDVRGPVRLDEPRGPLRRDGLLGILRHGAHRTLHHRTPPGYALHMSKAAIVTASDSGIGKATAVRLARDGYDVGITWHSDREGAEATAREVQAVGRRALVTQLDVTRFDDAGEVVETLAGELGGLDVFVNNAGGGGTHPLLA